MFKKKMVKKISVRSFVSTVFVIAVVYFLFRYLAYNWSEFENLEFRVNYFLLLISFLVWTTSYGLFSLVWRKLLIMIDRNTTVNRAESLKLYMLTEFSKYIPGVVWTVFARTYFSRNTGTSRTNLFTSSFIDAVLTTATTLFLGAVFVFLSFSGENHNLAMLAFLFAILGVISLHPKIFYRLLNLALKFFGKNEAEGQFMLNYRQILKMSFLYTVVYLFQVYSFFLFVASLVPMGIGNFWIIGSAYCLSIGIGILFIFAPSGIGVREGIMIAILGTIMPMPLAIVASIFSRLWMTIGEIILFVYSFALVKFTQNKSIG